MKKANQYKWLIIVEGITDVETYKKLLVRYGVAKSDFRLVSAHGKGFVCNSTTWRNAVIINAAQSSLFDLVDHDIGRVDFCGIILLVDSDSSNADVFTNYQRNTDLPYVEAVIPTLDNKGDFWFIDCINGVNQIPIYGINVPINSSGCLETDLLDSYGFPIEGQPEYANIVDAIKKASYYWKIRKHGDGKDWWEKNQKAKLDKFIYSAFSYGFEVSREEPALPNEPNVIHNIKMVLQYQVT